MNGPHRQPSPPASGGRRGGLNPPQQAVVPASPIAAQQSRARQQAGPAHSITAQRATAPARPPAVVAPHCKAAVIQGSFRGGLPVVQARFAANRPGVQTAVQPRAGSAQAGLRRPGQPGLQPNPPQTVQAHKRPGVEAFPVDLRPQTGGQALPPEVQAKMESALGADFSDVRIHVGREAASVGVYINPATNTKKAINPNRSAPSSSTDTYKNMYARPNTIR